MSANSRLIFDTQALKNAMMKKMVDEQSRRLIEYAKKTCDEIGAKIKTYNSRHHMDRTGHLLDSLCWCVAYRGDILESGFYQHAAHRNSYLHEFDENFEAFPVYGHTFAEKYIRQYGGYFHEGWRVVFAVLAPYWGYWEKGFEMKRHGKSLGFRQFAVMAEFRDKVEKDLKPAQVRYDTKAPEYTKSYNIGKTRVRGSLERRYDNWSK